MAPLLVKLSTEPCTEQIQQPAAPSSGSQAEPSTKPSAGGTEQWEPSRAKHQAISRWHRTVGAKPSQAPSHQPVDVGGKITVGTPMNHQQRSVSFPAFLDLALGEACKGKRREDLVFPGPTGTYLRYTDIREEKMSWFASAVKRSGVPRVTPHDLRHTAASFAVSANANVKAVQKMLGHSSAAMTLDVYAELFDDDLGGVAIAMNDVVSLLSVPKDSLTGKAKAPTSL